MCVKKKEEKKQWHERNFELASEAASAQCSTVAGLGLDASLVVCDFFRQRCFFIFWTSRGYWCHPFSPSFLPPHPPYYIIRAFILVAQRDNQSHCELVDVHRISVIV